MNAQTVINYSHWIMAHFTSTNHMVGDCTFIPNIFQNFVITLYIGAWGQFFSNFFS